MGRTRTAASDLDLEPLEVRVGLQGRVRALLSLALPHVEKMPSVVPLASLKEGAPERRPPLMNETKTRGGRLFLVSTRGSFGEINFIFRDCFHFTCLLCQKKSLSFTGNCHAQLA